MKEQIARLAEKFINLEIIGLAFLLPLFFLPITTEFFELNKLVLLTVAVILGVLAWGLKAAVTGDPGMRRQPFDLPILFIWVATLISTLLSDSQLVSTLGQYARWHPSLISVTALTLLYFLISWNLKRETLQRVMGAFIASAGVAIILFIPQYFGANPLGKDWSTGTNFTPLGSLTALALFLGAISGLVLHKLLETEEPRQKALLAALLVLFPVTLTLLNNPVGWVAGAVSIIVSFLTSSPERMIRSKFHILTVFAVAAAFAAIVLIPPLFGKTTTLNVNLPREINLDLKTSWSVSATSFRQKPFWGSGPSTFLFDFTRYKPLRFNQTSFWTLRFDKPLSEYLLTFAEEGLLGILAWLFLIGTLIRTALRTNNRRLLPAAVAVLAGYLLTHSTIVPSFILFLALATGGGNGQALPENLPERETKGGVILFAILLLLGGLGLYWLPRAYAAEVFHRKSLTNPSRQQTYDLQAQTVQTFPWHANYHLSLAQTSFLLANDLAGKANPTETDQENIRILVAQSISEARAAANLYPLNAGNWESLAQIYRSLIGLAQGAEDWTADSYRRAITLDLFNPLLRISFGGLYYQLGEFEQATEQFRAAVNLKPNYANAHYNLGRTYKELEKKDLAIQELELALRLSNPQVEGYEEAQQILEELKEQKE